MRRLLGAFILLAFSGISAWSSPALAIGQASVAAGGNACASLTLANNGAAVITAILTDITYDPAFLTPTGVTTPVSGKLAQGNVVTPGKYRVTVYGGTNVMVDGAVASICFDTAAGSCRINPLTFPSGNPTASDANANSVNVTGTPGSITTTGCATCTLSCTANASPPSGVAPLAVSFTSTAAPLNCSGSPSFAWAFGDGATSSQQNQSHTYTTAGTKNWTLTVSQDGQSCSKTGSITVSGGSGAPVLSIGAVNGAAGTNVCVPLTLTNNGTAVITAILTDITYDPAYMTPTGVTTPVSGKLAQGNIVTPGKYRVTIYGGTSVMADGPVASICFNTAAGIAQINPLTFPTGNPTASDANANPVNVTGTPGSITTTGSQSCSISCGASASQASSATPLSIAFHATATLIDCTGTPTYSWNFGDGGASTEQNPIHTYIAAGQYSWTLTAFAQGSACVTSGSISLIAGCCPMDVNCDGSVNVIDMIKVQRVILGLDACL
jgi:PKD repeat protein